MLWCGQEPDGSPIGGEESDDEYDDGGFADADDDEDGEVWSTIYVLVR